MIAASIPRLDFLLRHSHPTAGSGLARQGIRLELWRLKLRHRRWSQQVDQARSDRQRSGGSPPCSVADFGHPCSSNLPARPSCRPGHFASPAMSRSGTSRSVSFEMIAHKSLPSTSRSMGNDVGSALGTLRLVGSEQRTADSKDDLLVRRIHRKGHSSALELCPEFAG